jgi:murein DD-endopeptidase MepM/ murein hydrolase activator NlpD
MKKTRSKHRFTLMFIPGANSRIRRARLPNMILFAVPVFVLAVLLTIAAWLYDAKWGYLSVIEALNHQLNVEKTHSEKIINSKDQTIQVLQTEIIRLTEQAEDVKKKLDDLKKLEEEIRELSDIGEPTGELSSAGNYERFRSMGGAADAVTNEEMNRLIQTTQTSYRQLNTDIRTLSESLSSIKTILREIQHLENITPSIWPTRTRTITSGFGVRRDPFTGRPSFHAGIDIAGNRRDPVFSTAQGVVQFVGSDGTHGKYIIINHSNGIRTVYMHLSKIIVNAGEQVEKGQTIGLVGSTGRSTGPHLHYEVHKDYREINPMTYIP